jgi:hypothetical protein
VAATAALCIVVVSSSAVAQGNGGFGGQGLFARRIGPPVKHMFDVTFGLTEAYDDDVLSEAPAQRGATWQGGYYSMAQAAGSYSHDGRTTKVAANFNTDMRYYNDLGTMKPSTSSVAAGFSTRLGGRTTWTANQSLSYAPSYFYGVFPGAAPPAIGQLPPSASTNYTLNTTNSYAASASTSLTRSISPRSNLTASLDGSYSKVSGALAIGRDPRWYGMQGGYHTNLNRNTVLNVVYRFRDGDVGFSSARSTSEHGLEAGIEMSRPLSATRRATLSFTLGPSATHVPETLVTGPAAGADRTAILYRISGGVRASYQFTRTWNASGSFRRGLEYIPTLITPVFSNGASVSVAGLLTRRLSFTETASYSTGDSAIRSASVYTSYAADTRLQYALTRMWAVSMEYLNYYYDFRGTGQLLPGQPSALTRNGVRAGLTIWVPVVGR